MGLFAGYPAVKAEGTVIMAEDVRERRERPIMLLAALFASFLIFSACQPRPSLVKPRLENGGAVFIYLHPFPQEASRLYFRVEGISAVNRQGEAFPLSLHVKEFNGKELNRERLLASGELPAGTYEGFSLRTKGATLKGEEGEIALLSAAEATRTDVPFTVAGKKAIVLSMRFLYKDSVPEGFRFTPSFSVTVPGKIPTGTIGLATSRGFNAVMMFDKVSGQVVGVIPTGESPSGIVLDPVSRKAYVAIPEEDAVEAIDLLDAAVIVRQRLTAGDNPLELAIVPDGKTLLSANSGSGTVSFIDSASLVERKRLQVGTGPQSLLIDRNGRRAYVFNTLSNTISVIDIGAAAVAATIGTESGPVRGQLNRTGNRLYVLHRNSPFLAVMDPVSLSVLRRIHIGAGGTALKVDPRTDLVYLAKRFGDEIDIYDPFSFLPVDALRAGGEASYMTVDGDGNRLLIVLPGSGRLRIVNLVGKETAVEVDLGDDPYQAAVMGEK